MRLAPFFLSIVILGMPGNLEAAKVAKRARHASSSIHKVRRGETAVKVARDNGLSLAELAALNPGMNLSKLSIGTPLRVKGRPEAKVAKATPSSDEESPSKSVSMAPVSPIPVIPVNGPTVLVHLERLLPTNMDASRGTAARKNPPPVPPMTSEDLVPVLPAIPGQEGESQETAELGFEPADPGNLDLLWPVETRSISSAWGPRMRTRTVRVVRARKKRRVRVRYKSTHRGVDLNAPMGSDVYAAQDGRVVVSERHKQYGNYVILDHGNGVQTAYAHHQVNLVQVGEIVRRGQKIAQVGSTGRSTGPHLHFELRLDGERQNPLPVLNDAEEIPAEMMALNETIKVPRK